MSSPVSATTPTSDQESGDASQNPARPEAPSRNSSAQRTSLLQQAVRFASGVTEISPPTATKETSGEGEQDMGREEELSPEQKDEIRTMALNLHRSRLQESRMNNFAFEAVSLPPSQAPSRETSPSGSHRRSLVSPRVPPSPSSLHSPPLTPAGSNSRDVQSDRNERAKRETDPAAMTPQTSPPHEETQPSPMITNSRPSSVSEQASTRPTSISDTAPHSHDTSKKVPRFSIGPSGESSPADTPTAVTPPKSSPRLTPAEQKLAEIDPRLAESGEAKKEAVQSSVAGGLLPVPPSPGAVSANKDSRDKRSSIFGGKKDPYGHVANDASSSSLSSTKPHGSMSELKRFFRGIGGHKKKDRSRPTSPAPTSRKSTSKSTISMTSKSTAQSLPFSDDHGLEARYGKFGKILGSGAGGSVRLLKRSSDGTTFAVKQFRERHNWESEKDYAKKVTAEFCIGSTLHHGNIIETLDIIQENGHWFEVMEYAPYDLFAIVMTGKMSREEVACCFLQIVNGVNYLHSMGLAHRDLKLDNVVVNEFGIMKLIDFGSATVFRYPFEDDLVLASGIVGSDPYLAPEVYDERKYDPRPTDVWSLAIIFCCMTLRRFPWKQPRVIDNSYKLFVAPPTPGTPVPGAEPRRPSEAKDDSRHNSTSGPSGDKDQNGSNGQHHHHHHAQSEENSQGHRGSTGDAASGKQEVIKGPWRLLRILPRESRYIIGRMLRVDPKERATMEELMSDEWVNSTPVCRQTEMGKVERAPGHTHTLEPSNASSAPPSKK